jgi:Zn-dependent peptidase ImmA (M78 family)
MEFNKFKEIVLRNRTYEDHIEEVLEEFNNKVNWTGDIPKMIKEIGNKLDTFIIQIPMKDPEFGACYLDTSYSKYLLLNSSQARNKMYFSFCHDVYHILRGTTGYINEMREVHLNQSYFDDEIEMKANFFAANLLMPKIQFRNLFNKYTSENEKLEDVTIKLMAFFEAPYISVLLRICELKLIESTEQLQKLLRYDMEKIDEKFEDLWLEKDCLTSSKVDEFKYLYKTLNEKGRQLNKKGLLSDYDFDKLMKNIESLYLKVKAIDDE